MGTVVAMDEKDGVGQASVSKDGASLDAIQAEPMQPMFGPANKAAALGTIRARIVLAVIMAGLLLGLGVIAILVQDNLRQNSLLDTSAPPAQTSTPTQEMESVTEEPATQAGSPVLSEGGPPATAEVVCGDAICTTSAENSDLCPQDCQCTDDNVCNPGEGLGCRDCGAAQPTESCQANCSSEPPPAPACGCGNGVCEPNCGEDVASCARDCSAPAPACGCGNGACEPNCGEDVASCPADCPVVP